MSRRDTKVYVGNLSSSTTRGDLEYEFDYYGHLINVWVAKNPPGFAYVEFEDYRDAEDAIKGLDGKEINGRRIRVEWSHGGPRGRDSFGIGSRARRSFHPSDRCYNCGEAGHYAYDCDLYHRRNSRSSRRSRRSYSRSRSRSRSRTPRRRRRSRSNSRSRSRTPRRRSPSRSRSRSRSRSQRRRSRSDSRGRRSGSESKKRRSRESSEEKIQNGGRSPSKSRSRSRSRSRSHS